MNPITRKPSLPSPSRSVPGPRRRPGRSRLAVVGVAAAAALADWAILVPLAGLTLTARQGGTLGSPLTNGIGTGAKLGLASLHLVVGAVVVLGLRRTALSAAERC